MSLPIKTIYLAGPITGCVYDDARYGWRKDFVDIMSAIQAERASGDESHIHCFSPMREKEFLKDNQCIGAKSDYASLHGFGTPQGILTRDSNDVRNCDAMIANFLDAKRVSIGTCVEVGIALENRKPLIMVMEATTPPTLVLATGEVIPGFQNIHDHLFLRACAGYVVPTLKHAAEIAYSLLTPSL